MVSEGGSSIWDRHGAAARRMYPTLSGDLKGDVVVVGAGITGLTTALRLQEVGTRVVVLELDRVAGGTTGHSTGHLDVLPERTLHGLMGRAGVSTTGRVIEARQRAIDQVEHWSRSLGVGCGFRRVPGYLYAELAGEVEELEREQAAAKRVELLAEWRSQAPLPFETEGALRLPHQGRFDPAAYVRGLGRAFVERGGRLFEQTQVERIESDGQEAAAMTNHGIVSAEAIVLAGHAPMLGLFSSEARTFAHQSYVLAVRVEEPGADALYWDLAKPYHYTRQLSEAEPGMLLIGGADHAVGETPAQEPWGELERYARQRYAVREIEGRWSHELWESADGLPFIGKVPESERVYIATGFGGEGLSYGTVAGLLLSDQVLGSENAWSGVFDPGRVSFKESSRHMLAQMLHVTRHYVGDRVASAQVERVEDVRPGEGAMVSVEGRKVAVYRDEQGVAHAMSPVCRHRGCLVNWNARERTWDCPCHGGRYDARGNVIVGPPLEPLVRETLDEPRARTG